MVFGKGINDVNSKHPAYSIWHSMLRRSYSKVYHKNKPTYIGTEVSPEWYKFSNFIKWYDDNYIEGWHLDKDLLSNGCKLYSKDTCCFLPNEINILFSEKRQDNGLPLGVSVKKCSGKYIAQISFCENGVRKSGHIGTSRDPMLCFEMYKSAKEAKIKELANKYKEQLNPNVYSTLMNYIVIP